MVVNSSLGMATPGCQSSPEFTSIGRDWAEEVKRKNGRPAPSQVPLHYVVTFKSVGESD